MASRATVISRHWARLASMARFHIGNGTSVEQMRRWWISTTGGNADIENGNVEFGIWYKPVGKTQSYHVILTVPVW